jgi:hypothetical protein
MTLPEQSDRAVTQTREFLVRLVSPYVENGIKGIRRDVRAEALALLRHYPHAWQVSQKCDCPDADNATNHDAAPAARAQPDTAGRDSGNAAGAGDTLTDAERMEIEKVRKWAGEIPRATPAFIDEVCASWARRHWPPNRAACWRNTKEVSDD